MAIENGDRSDQNPEKNIEGILIEEVSRFGDNPEEFISNVLDDWIRATEGKKFRVSRTGIVRDEVKRLIERGDSIGAMLLFVNHLPESAYTHKLQPNKLREKRRSVFQAISEEPVITLNSPSPTFMLGHDAHRILESIVSGGDYILKNTRLISDTLVRGFQILESESVQINFNGIEDTLQTKIVKFEEPIEIPKVDESLTDWSKRIIRNSFAEIATIFGSLPQKPYDLEQISRNPRARSALMQALEVSHLVFGVESSLSFVNWEDEQMRNGKIEFLKVEEFAALNLLALSREYINKHIENGKSEDTGMLTELSEGNLNIYVNGNTGDTHEYVPVGPRRIDLFKVGWINDNKPHDLINLNSATRKIEGEFHRQKSRYRRNAVINGSPVEVKTELSRNLREYYRELVRIYGNAVFTDMNFQVIDFKFPGGDGGWFTQFNTENLPVRSHSEQLLSYMFKSITQLYWVYKWQQLVSGKLEVINIEGLQSETPKGNYIISPNWDDFPVKIEEIAEFVFDMDLLKRINAQLRYQLPQSEIIIDVGKQLSELSREEFIKWGYSILGIDKGLPRMLMDRNRVLNALVRLTRHKLESREFTYKNPIEIPDELKELCVGFRGAVYLSVEKLSDIIRGHLGSGNVVIDSAVEYSDLDTWVFWLSGLFEGGPVQVAVDRNANFYISGFNAKALKGRLLSGKEMIGVAESGDNLLNLFKQQFWQKLNSEELGISVDRVESQIKDGEIYIPGKGWEKLIEGKPIVCTCDPITGVWSLDPKLLSEAVESDASRKDLWHLYELADLVVNKKFRSKQMPVYCPLPTHDNRNTAAAALYINENERMHINCFSCNLYIQIPDTKLRYVNLTEVASGDDVSDYSPVSVGRRETFGSIMRVANIFSQQSELPVRYIQEERGLSVADVGNFGYIPIELNQALVRIVNSEVFRNLYKHDNRLRLDQLRTPIGLFKESGVWEDFLLNLDQVMETVNQLPESLRGAVLENMTLKSLDEMRRRKILEYDSDSKLRLGGRVIFPTYWLLNRPQGSTSLVQGNYNARGISIGGINYFKGQPQHKVPLVGGKKEINGKRLRPTPVGFWFRDPKQFLLEVDDTVIILEGVLNTATFGRMCPDLKDICITNVGLGYRGLIAFLRWLGVRGDSGHDSSQGMGKQIKYVCLGPDFDQAGANAYMKYQEVLKREFPGIGIIPIHTFLPNDVLNIVPEYKPENFAPNEEGRHLKMDLNDLIKPLDRDTARESGIDEVLFSKILEIRKKYGFRF